VKTLDQQIADHLAEAGASGELRAAPSYGKPLMRPEGWDETPEELRQAFKILKDAGFAPPEVALFHERARLRAMLESEERPGVRASLERELSDLEQKIALRLESIRMSSRL
jgi:hypothetical protein